MGILDGNYDSGFRRYKPFDPNKQFGSFDDYSKSKNSWMRNDNPLNNMQIDNSPIPTLDAPTVVTPPTGMMSNLGSSSGMLAMGAGAVGGLVGGLLGNQEIKSQNNALNKSIGTFQSQLADLKKKREEATQFRRGEATDFLTNYVTARDPNRSAQISQMYTTGQDRYRNELQANDSMQTQVTGAIGQLQSQKQKEKNAWEIGGETLLGAASMLPYALMG